ncbi:HAD-IB family hydrolase [Vandammella animalimorsus]|uniref:HAD-IB family hydrolase n=1 Tax=Vandammella animalimorsus TaxID=2029117 RepID=A0A2A2T942_9BURK|nr:HAD family hydrolase [Vandammella animalimorsus]PAT31561.1 HAD-IB family hydrolase [Vandammella animalimorsus]PAX18603.1 HAD-IB family hydrolase [Vandammella animalimorsus]PAX20766.1 HAD-IB family hydrolase [Vandammella animalimorsus]
MPSHATTTASPPAADTRVRLALFDLDHTLLPLDSDYEWGQFSVRQGLVEGQAFAQRNAEFFEQYRAGTLDLAQYIRFATEAICRLGPDASLAARQRFMTEVIAPAILPPAQALLQRHRDAGDEVLIVTATNIFVTEPIAQALGVPRSHLLAVELERDAHSGWYNGQIAGVPSMREGKVTRVAQWLQQRGWAWSQVHTTFYSDSRNDLPLLEQVDVPVAVNPDPMLRQHAQQRGWAIMDLFAPA